MGASAVTGELSALASSACRCASVVAASRAAALQLKPVGAHTLSHDSPLSPHRQCGKGGGLGGGEGGGGLGGGEGGGGDGEQSMRPLCVPYSVLTGVAVEGDSQQSPLLCQRVMYMHSTSIAQYRAHSSTEAVAWYVAMYGW